jgi:hypothetical protein
MKCIKEEKILPCLSKSCMCDANQADMADRRYPAWSPIPSEKTLKDILKEQFRVQVIEKAVFILLGGLIVAVIYFWRGHVE